MVKRQEETRERAREQQERLWDWSGTESLRVG